MFFSSCFFKKRLAAQAIDCKNASFLQKVNSFVVLKYISANLKRLSSLLACLVYPYLQKLSVPTSHFKAMECKAIACILQRKNR